MTQEKKLPTSFADIFKKPNGAPKSAVNPLQKTPKKVCWLLRSSMSIGKEN